MRAVRRYFNLKDTPKRCLAQIGVVSESPEQHNRQDDERHDQTIPVQTIGMGET